MTFKQNVSQGLIKILNYRIVQEEFSSRLYKAMSVWLNFKGYSGAAKLWAKYSSEEQTHAEWAYTYLLDMDIKPEVPALDRPDNEFAGLVDIINRSYEHEQKVTEQCQKFAESAWKEGDYMALELAQKYLKEQSEELKKTSDWVNMLEIYGSSKESLFLLDNKMGES